MRQTVLRWALFSAFLLLTVAFATAVLVIFRADEVASPTRGGISPSEMAWPRVRAVGFSAAVGFVSLIAATLLWMLRAVPAPGAGTANRWAARASLVAIPLVLYVAQMVAVWHVDRFFLGDPLNPVSTPQPWQVPTPTPVGAPARAPGAVPWGTPQYPDLTGPGVITYVRPGDSTIRNSRRYVIQGVRMADGGCRMGPSPPHSAFPGGPIPAGQVLALDPATCRYLYEEGEYAGPPPDTLSRNTGPTPTPMPAAPSRDHFSR